MNSKRAMAQLLKHLTSAGVTHLPKVEIQKPSRISAKPKPSASVAESAPPDVVRADSSASERTSKRSAAPSPATDFESRRSPSGLISPKELQATADRPQPLQAVQEIMDRTSANPEQKTQALCGLADMVANCRRCSDLTTTRTQTVFGVGNPNADIMFIGEAPGAEEDAKGEPFVGPAGQLLNKIIEASQLKREDLYLCNILRCRPPGNRNPLPQEAVNCREFLDAQIHIVQPRYIICWGTVAAQNLLGKTEAVGKLRGQFFDYQGIKVLCTYHPSYLLRTPAAKKQVWEDMKFFMKDLGVELQ